jgi:hypothetical protein
MGKLFWIGNVAVLVGAMALWGVGTRGAQRDADKKLKDVQGQRMQIEREWKDRDRIVNPLFIKAAQVEKQLLRDEKETIREVMRSRDLNVSDKEFDWGGSPPPLGGSLADIRQWLEKKYQKKNELLAEAKVIFPSGTNEAKMRGEIQDWEKELTPQTIGQSLRELVAMVEVVQALADASVEVKYVVPNKETKNDEIKVEVHRVDEMKQLWFGLRKRPGGSREEAEGGKKGKPHVAHSVTVAFTAHYNVLADVMRRVESSRKALFVTRSVRMRPAKMEVQDYGEPAVAQHLRNQEDHEAPVEAEIRFGFLEFPAARDARAAEPAAD